MGNLYAPNGLMIVGTADTIPATAYILPGSVERNCDLSFEFEYLGGSDIHWDDQTTKMINNERLFVDEDGDIWRESRLEYREA